MLDKINIMYIIYAITVPIIIFSLLKTMLSKEKKQRKIYARIAAVLMFFIVILPLNKTIDKFNNKNMSIEEAFYFNYNQKKYDLSYKMKYKNTYFIYASSKKKNKIFDEYACFYNNGNGWKALMQPYNRTTTSINDGYEIFYCSNDNDHITGLFIVDVVKDNEFDENTVIEDKYGTKFNYIKDKNNNPIYRNDVLGQVNSYVYFGIVDKTIDKKYYLKINGDKIKIK